MSYLDETNRIIEESRRLRLGVEGGTLGGSSTYQTTTIEKNYLGPTTYVQQDYSYVPSTYQGGSSYQTSYIPSTTYQTYQTGPVIESQVSRGENVKRAGLHESGANVTTTIVTNSHEGGTTNGKLAIIMLGAEIERLLELGRDVEFRYNQLNIEITTLRETLTIREREVLDFRSKGDDFARLSAILEAKEKELQLLRSNVTETVVSPATEDLRRKLRSKEMEHSELQRKYEFLKSECNKMKNEIEKNKQSRGSASGKKRSAWCC